MTYNNLNLVIETYWCLPCSVSKFTINGKDADVYDFGEGCSDGSCMEVCMLPQIFRQ